MPVLTLNGRSLQVEPGTTILAAATQLGIEIPTLCFLKGLDPATHCMLCVVKVGGAKGLMPACATVVTDGMQVTTDDTDIHRARQTGLELLLSDHVGDCTAPCRLACPAHMHIPRMIRAIVAGDLKRAIEVVKADIALPAVLGRICPAPCEKACRRGKVDQPVSICLLKRFAADMDLTAAMPYRPRPCQSRGKRMAIVGAGPAGLAAAYSLQGEGFDCTVFDDRDKAGGMLRYGVSRESLPLDVLDQEIGLVAGLGVRFRPGVKVGRDVSLDQLRHDYDAVFVAVGQSAVDQAKVWGLTAGPKGLVVDAGTYQTNLKGVFAGGDAVRNRRLAVRSVADGKEAALCIRQFLTGQPVTGPERPFDTHMGTLSEEEQQRLLSLSVSQARTEPTRPGGGLSQEQARQEARRCLHCDCRKADACRLRQYSQAYDARPTRFKGHRRPLDLNTGHPEVLYESGKCIDCGLCVRITEQAGERLGLGFVGRGFDVRVAVPFKESLAAGLTETARRCVEACPTGALVFRNS
jgi:ferredoxin